MGSIWAFCLQTLTVSLVAALLLLLKRLLADKLSPRWQYGVWVLLALRALIPAKLGRSVIVNIGLWLETAKAMAESALDSAYSAVYTPISMNHVFPWISEGPRSVTDWLFIAYCAGVILLALRYLISYTVLRLRLGRGEAPNATVTEAMARVCGKYGLKPCRVVAVPGLESAFVCGIRKPVLAVPAGAAVDDKVILHELLHLKYGDIPQGIFWAALRCLHWCNPLMLYVFDRIGNDMESLCDQRVLERLEGEERREYGEILLSMASRRYARTPGTGSISNGAKNISRRIDAIVRFKKYPRGMALVSVCIVLVLLSPTLIGTAAAYESNAYCPDTAGKMTQAMAIARMQRCSTIAGAIDTYAKGLMQENGIYIAVASPLDTHEALAVRMGSNWYLDSGEGLGYLQTRYGYSIYDLIQNSDGSYDANLVFAVDAFEEEAYQELITEGQASVVIPLRIFREGDAWVLEERAARNVSDTWFDQIEYYGDDMPWLAEQTVRCETGTVTVRHRSRFNVDNTVATNSWFGNTGFDNALKPDAAFDYVSWNSQVIYQCDLEGGNVPEDTAELKVWCLGSMDELEKITDLEKQPNSPDDAASVQGGSNSGEMWCCANVSESWDGELYCDGGGGSGSGNGLDTDELPTPPAGYLILIYFDGVLVDEIVLEGVQS